MSEGQRSGSAGEREGREKERRRKREGSRDCRGRGKDEEKGGVSGYRRSSAAEANVCRDGAGDSGAVGEDSDRDDRFWCCSSSKVDDDDDDDFDFKVHKQILNRLFFGERAFIRKDSSLYKDFWNFLEKYKVFQQKLNIKKKDKIISTLPENSLDLPRRYDNMYRVNLGLVSKDISYYLRKGRLPDTETNEQLNPARVLQFKNILLHYLDFCQKQKFNKLKKIKDDQQNLPIWHYREKIVSQVKDNQIVVVAGDTGCGKSTQVPQYLLEAGFTNIACSQPRRIACISLSKRVGYETLNEYGSQVAYQVRFEKTKTKSTRILFLTEGLLLRQMSSDPYLSQYNVLILDEVHERHIFTDFLLGLLKCLLQQRDDLKLVLMSATINIHLFSDYFDGAPVIKVPGRLYPIKLKYQPILKDSWSPHSSKIDPEPYVKVMQAIDSKYSREERGDLLIFLSGMTDIMTIVEAARLYAEQTKAWIVLPLHSALSISEQDKVFDIAPEGARKCIVSTNIAETSVTIDGVRFIVDSGKVKEMSFDPKCKMQRLQEFWISRASAEQRKGRAGRTGPGVCFRLYSESDYNEFQDYSTPEIQRVPLDSLILQMVAMGLPDARKFPFIEEPSTASIENSLAYLKEQGAVTEDETLTPTGQMLSRLPVDVVVGKLLIMGSIFHMIDPVLSIAAAMSVQSPFISRMHIDHDTEAARKSLQSDHGDPFTLLNAFDAWIQVKAKGCGTKKWCKRKGLEEQRFYEISKLKKQFRDLLQDHNLVDKTLDAPRYYTSIERCQKYNEKKRLYKLKWEEKNASKRRKVLKLENDFAISDEEEQDEGEDIKDLEFRVTNDLNQLEERSNQSRSFTLREVNLLKIILGSGLCSQIAVADECNTFKADSEQAFHTKNKAFVLLHPTSVFSSHPEVLQPQDANSDKSMATSSSQLHNRMSSKHELLTFVSLLETNKPYLMNAMRIPALQTLTLFCNSLDTNSDCSRLVCDGWLEIRFNDPQAIEQTLSTVIQLRSSWQNLIKLRLQDTFESLDEDKRISPRARKLERALARKLAEFLDSYVVYAVRRILPAEMKHLYVGQNEQQQASTEILQNVFKATSKNVIHPVKGGIRINDYLTYSCLLDDASAAVWGEYTANMQKHWTCPQCDTSMIMTVLERLQHQEVCHNQTANAKVENSELELSAVRNDQLNCMRKAYHCPVCNQDFKFTTTETLKHRKSHHS